MKIIATFIIPCLVLSFSLSARPDKLKSLEYDVQRLSDRVITISTLTGNSRLVALASQKGLVVIDTMWSPSSAAAARKIIEKEFKRRDFIYVINSNQDDLSSRGNGAFPEAVVVAHEECKKGLIREGQKLQEHLQGRADEFHERVVRTQKMLKDIDSKSRRAAGLRNWIDLCAQVEKDMRQGYEIVLPAITFTDKMTLDLGDMNLHLIYYGKAGNDGDILVKVPEAGLLFLGDFFHAYHTIPFNSDIRQDIEVSRWLQVLDQQIEESEKLTHLVRANGPAYSIERLIQARDLIKKIWKATSEADREGKSLDTVQEIFKHPETVFPFIQSWPHQSLIKADIHSLIIRLWRKTHDSAAEEMAKILEQQPPDAVKTKLASIKKNVENIYYFSEAELNTYGYRLLSEGKNREAITLFTLAAEMFPQSANAWDSLAEGHMKSGHTELAIAYYRKSLQLNPQNHNAAAMLKKLESGN